jgi:restriction system protein
MAIPDFQTCMLPALKVVANKDVSRARDIVNDVIAYFKLSEQEQQELLPSKTQRIIDNRVLWSLSYLSKAGLVMRPKRGYYSITTEGQAVLSKKPAHINIDLLMQYEQFKTFRELKHEKTPVTATESSLDTNPMEVLENSYEELKATVLDELLRSIQKIDPTDFEKLVLELLNKMGYGGEQDDAIMHQGRSGDGGVDGEINQDALGLDRIYVQAKRYQDSSTIGRPSIQQFVGSLNERKSKRGVFITTSKFSQEAKDYVEKVDSRVVLIDGLRLVELMYQYNLGVESSQVFEIKTINSDYFQAA